MSIDLIDRIIYMESLGNIQPKQRVLEWLKESENNHISEFILDDKKFYWRIISSKRFLDIIDEDETDWFFINSENGEFKAIAKIRNGFENLIGEKNEHSITTIWILKSNIETLKVCEKPILIWTPHHFYSKMDKINYDFKQLIIKLQNPKTKLTEFVSYNVSKVLTKRIR